MNATPLDEAVARYQTQFVDLIAAQLERNEAPLRALELMCGDGFASFRLLPLFPAESQLVALCEERQSLKAMHETMPAEFRGRLFPRKESTSRLPFAAEVFDLVWSSQVRNPFANPKALVRQALHVLKPGGMLVLATPVIETFMELVRIASEQITDPTRLENLRPALLDRSRTLDVEGWVELLRRAGAQDVRFQRARLELQLGAPMSSARVFTQHLLPIALPGDFVRQAELVRLFDTHISTPQRLIVTIACIVGRKGTPATTTATPPTLEPATAPAPATH